MHCVVSSRFFFFPKLSFPFWRFSLFICGCCLSEFEKLFVPEHDFSFGDLGFSLGWHRNVSILKVFFSGVIALL